MQRLTINWPRNLQVIMSMKLGPEARIVQPRDAKNRGPEKKRCSDRWYKLFNTDCPIHLHTHEFTYVNRVNVPAAVVSQHFYQLPSPEFFFLKLLTLIFLFNLQWLQVQRFLHKNHVLLMDSTIDFFLCNRNLYVCRTSYMT